MTDEARVTLDPQANDAVVFDMDGVLTDTARVHARAWKQMFDEYLEARGGELEPFDADEDYAVHVDGKARYDGVRSFLASRGIELEEGDPDDPPDRETVCGLGNRKNRLFLERLREEGPERFEDAVALVRALREAGVGVAVISASRNAKEVLETAGIADLFAVRVDGVVADEEDLAGKPAPDVFVEAARRLGARPERTAIFEDALSGVEAGRRGGFGRVIGVARHGGAERLREAGADVVVRDLSEIVVAAGDPDAARERPIDGLPSALEDVEAIAGEAAGREVVLFLDFDGTLAPIVDRPEEAALPPESRELLAGLSARRTVAIVSGRDLEDLRERVDLPRLYYAGSHGFQLAGPGGWREDYPQAHRFLPALAEAEKHLAERLASQDGVQVERKRYAVAVHFRRASEDAAARARRAAEEALERSGGLRMGEGRKVVELRPAIDWDKGKALGWLLERLGPEASGTVPVYLGDDVTDEDAFRAVEERGGVAVVVRGREGRTRARYALEDPAAVRRFLARLDDALPDR